MWARRHIFRVVGQCLVSAAVLLGISGCGGGGDATSSKEGGLIPSSSAFYSVSFIGQNAFGTFTRSGCLYIEPQIVPPAGSINFNNGPNARDVGFAPGNPIIGQTGAIWYGTNSSMCSIMNLGCNLAASGLDVAFVQADESAGTLRITVDGQYFSLPNAFTFTLNIFNQLSGVTAQIFHITSGDMLLQFANAGQAVTGTFSVTGISTGLASYTGTITSGTKVNSCVP